MRQKADFGAERRGVAMRMAIAAAISVSSISAAVLWGTAAPLTERLYVAIALDIVVLAWLAAAIGNVARLRFASAQDIAGSAAANNSSRTVVNAVSIIQNTLEQSVLAIPVHFALAFVYDRAVLLLVILGVLFFAGRIAFWSGYPQGARARALGFGLTFYPTLGALLLLASLIAAKLF